MLENPNFVHLLMRANPLETTAEKITSIRSLSETVNDIALPKYFTGWLLMKRMNMHMFDLDK